MENKLLVRFICGINGDRVEATVINPKGEVLLKKELIYGVNVSSSRKNAEYSLQECQDAIKYNWSTPRAYKPFIGEVLMDIVETHFINDITYSGYYVFSNKEMTEDDIERRVNAILKEL